MPPLTKIGALQALDFAGPVQPVVILFHGYGADAFDLAQLREELGLEREARWLFPQGPKAVEIGPGFWGRAWFPIDIMAHERAMESGEAISYAERRPPGVNEARDQAVSFVKALQVPAGRIVIGGFSQGAMLAVEVAVALEESPAALVLLSGTLADRAGLEARAPKHKGLRFFQSHGERDQVLPFGGGEALYGELERAGWAGTWCGFGGGHEIPPVVIKNLSQFLRGVLG